MKNYLLNILIVIDKFINVLFSPVLNLLPNLKYKFGDHRDTLSEVFGRNRENCKACYFVCRALHWFDKNHCEESIED